MGLLGAGFAFLNHKRQKEIPNLADSGISSATKRLNLPLN